MDILPIIRPMTTDDTACVAAIERECFSDAWSENLIKGELENSNAVVYVAEVDGKTVGYINFYNIVGEGSINRVAVLPEFRGKSVAAALMKRMIAYAVENKLLFVTLEVRKSNVPAISLYKKFGFKDVGLRKNFYNAPVEDAVLMTLDGENYENIGD